MKKKERDQQKVYNKTFLELHLVQHMLLSKVFSNCSVKKGRTT